MLFLTEILSRAAEAELPFLLIGGNAVIAYGYPRMTRDLDLLVRDPDRRRWDELIRALGFREHQIARVFHMYNPVDHKLPPIDLMVVDEGTFNKLYAASAEHTIHGLPVRLPSLAHLIALKLHALKSGAAHRLELDFGDVVTLIDVNKIDLAAGEYPDILNRYATESIREELYRRLRRFGPAAPGS